MPSSINNRFDIRLQVGSYSESTEIETKISKKSIFAIEFLVDLWYTNDSNRYRLEHSYDNLEYDIELNNIIINKIKKYNSSNDYFNFDYDNFIKDIGLKVGGN